MYNVGVQQFLGVIMEITQLSKAWDPGAWRRIRSKASGCERKTALQWQGTKRKAF